MSRTWRQPVFEGVEPVEIDFIAPIAWGMSGSLSSSKCSSLRSRLLQLRKIEFCAAHQVKVHGREVSLTATEFALLRVLVQHAGKVVTHKHLLRTVWGPNAEEQSQYLRVYFTHLRKKLETESTGKLIQNEPGIGYSLLAVE